MENVALELQTTAYARRAVPKDLDVFGRSAFNRYYYATFLEVRQSLKKFNPNWQGTHSSIPEELTGSITREIANIQRSVARIPDNQAVSICKIAKRSLRELADLMKDAYSVRVIADYYPDISIQLDAGRFKLDRTNITTAHDWLYRAQTYIMAIERARSILHVA